MDDFRGRHTLRVTCSDLSDIMWLVLEDVSRWVDFKLDSMGRYERGVEAIGGRYGSCSLVEKCWLRLLRTYLCKDYLNYLPIEVVQGEILEPRRHVVEINKML